MACCGGYCENVCLEAQVSAADLAVEAAGPRLVIDWLKLIHRMDDEARVARGQLSLF